MLHWCILRSVIKFVLYKHATLRLNIYIPLLTAKWKKEVYAYALENNLYDFNC